MLSHLRTPGLQYGRRSNGRACPMKPDTPLRASVAGRKARVSGAPSKNSLKRGEGNTFSRTHTHTLPWEHTSLKHDTHTQTHYKGPLLKALQYNVILTSSREPSIKWEYNPRGASGLNALTRQFYTSTTRWRCVGVVCVSAVGDAHECDTVTHCDQLMN